ncbi:APC family permease [Streptomyces niveus]|uniref:APC family permease n=1 Tax=Streptomyces niveus TaxID=193462 RepID=UPI0036BD94D9
MAKSSDTRGAGTGTGAGTGAGTGPGADSRPVRLANAGLTTKDLVFFVVAAAAPLTVMAGVVPLAIRTGGESAAYGYIVPGAILLLFAAGFTAMSPMIKNAGAFYSYIARGLGRPLGIGSALVALVAYNAMAVCLLAGFAYYTANTFSSLFGLDVPWQLIAVVGTAAVAFLGYSKVTLGARVLGIALGLELLVLVVYEVFVLVKGGASGPTVSVFAPSLITHDGFGALLVLTAGGFIGFEATALYAEEVRDPARTIPRATYIAIGFLAVFYTFSVWCVFVAYGSEGALAFAGGDDVANMTFASITHYVGAWAADFGQILLCTSAFAAALAFHNAASRYFFALGRQRVLPTAFGRIHRRSGAPVGGTVAQTVLNAVVLGLAMILGADPYLVVFLWSAAPGVLGILALEALTALAVVFFFARNLRGHSPWRVLIAPAVAAVGLVVLVWLSISQLDLLTAAGSAVNWALLLPLPALFLVGVVMALRIRRRDPVRYESLGTEDVEG